MQNSDLAFSSGLFHYRITVEIDASEIKRNHARPAFFQTFGITASNASQAVDILERKLSEGLMGEYVIEITITPLHPHDIPEEVYRENPVHEIGIHFVSGRIYFDPLE